MLDLRPVYHRTEERIRAHLLLCFVGLEWQLVQSIVARYEALNPYDPELVPGSILKIEEINYDPTTGLPRTSTAIRSLPKGTP